MLIEEFFSFRSIGTDNKSDTTHIRNSIAHGRFEFTSENVIRFRDVTAGNITFDEIYNDGDLLMLSNIFEMKVKFTLLYFRLAELPIYFKDKSIKLK